MFTKLIIFIVVSLTAAITEVHATSNTTAPMVFTSWRKKEPDSSMENETVFTKTPLLLIAIVLTIIVHLLCPVICRRFRCCRSKQNEEDDNATALSLMAPLVVTNDVLENTNQTGGGELQVLPQVGVPEGGVAVDLECVDKEWEAECDAASPSSGTATPDVDALLNAEAAMLL